MTPRRETPGEGSSLDDLVGSDVPFSPGRLNLDDHSAASVHEVALHHVERLLLLPDLLLEPILGHRLTPPSTLRIEDIHQSGAEGDSFQNRR